MKTNGKRAKDDGKTLVDVKETEIGKVAREFLDIRDKITSLQEEYLKKSNELVVLMKKESRSRLAVDGCTLTVKYVSAQEKIQIKNDV